ncbi:hypothetical protein HLH34_04420 [Gluconacetobacter azotocaptans]|uniref:Uncharacterized protein n=1 Tax=Gluconacetobacter azotocaptans TaxID=142834 RepID=A0A7W4PE92_9PROT|nr:hypothetical protein [Gluconacetobacter azotocaptans]MBB2189209.1 hypothetical protein [Gluconacetobacter azotocaptans]GBQ32268.1 hypothetical protein AA13594_2317 [Gluconacetobacter azotocaptans DSM 13594]
MTLYRVELREAVAAAILGANTAVGANVFTARTMPSRAADLPNVYIQSPSDRGESLNRGPPQFLRTAQIMVVARVSASSGPAAETALDALTEQIELAIMTNSPLLSMIQQVSSMEIGIRVNADTNPVIGEARMDFYLEWTEFYPITGPALTSITGTLQSGGNTDFAAMDVTFPQS